MALKGAIELKKKVSLLEEGIKEIIVSIQDGDLADCCYEGSCKGSDIEKKLTALLDKTKGVVVGS